MAIKKLENSDVGARVIYSSFDKEEEGVIKNFNNGRKVAWVVFHCNNEWENYRDYTAQCTNYSDLRLKYEN